MISDVLFEAIEGIDHYLNDPAFDDMYDGEMRERILTVRLAMEKLRIWLDTPHNDDDETRRVWEEENRELREGQKRFDIKSGNHE